MVALGHRKSINMIIAPTANTTTTNTITIVNTTFIITTNTIITALTTTRLTLEAAVSPKATRTKSKEDKTLPYMKRIKGRSVRIFPAGGSTLTEEALQEAATEIFPGSARKGVPRTCIVMTDGRNWSGSDAVIGPAATLRVNSSSRCAGTVTTCGYGL